MAKVLLSAHVTKWANIGKKWCNKHTHNSFHSRPKSMFSEFFPHFADSFALFKEHYKIWSVVENSVAACLNCTFFEFQSHCMCWLLLLLGTGRFEGKDLLEIPEAGRVKVNSGFWRPQAVQHSLHTLRTLFKWVGKAKHFDLS